jgi:hypothetical protein
LCTRFWIFAESISVVSADEGDRQRPVGSC